MKLNLEKRDILKFNKLLGFIDENILSSIPYGKPRERETFVTSITYDDVKTFIEEKIIGFNKVYVLNGEPGEGKEDILDYIHKRLMIKDCHMEIYYNPLNPNFIEHIVLPDLKLAFVSENEFNNLRFKGQILSDAINPIDSYEKELYFINFHEFIKLAISELKNTSIIHRDLEKIYKKAMNFDEVNKIYDEILNQVLN
jgi:hypothetical protein